MLPALPRLAHQALQRTVVPASTVDMERLAAEVRSLRRLQAATLAVVAALLAVLVVRWPL